MKQNGILGNLNKNPGPGKYDSNPSTLSNVKYSMRINTNTGCNFNLFHHYIFIIIVLSKFNKNPGPG